jgi:hypothetical protein
MREASYDVREVMPLTVSDGLMDEGVFTEIVADPLSLRTPPISDRVRNPCGQSTCSRTALAISSLHVPPV